MRPIPLALRFEMESDPFYKKCCITGQLATSTKIDWHHNLIYAGRQVNEKWCILPLARAVHDDIIHYKEKCDWIMLNRADDDTLRRYSKTTDLIRRRTILNKKYGTPRSQTTKPQ